MATDNRFIQGEGTQVYTGAELVIKGALEAGVSLLTGYPGSPIADLFTTAHSLKDLLKEHGILVQVANNEALGAARLNGSQMEDIRAIVAMKSVGAHVASDALALGNLSKTGSKGGALVLIGDDPWSDSTQVPSDSRFLAKHLHMPILEPSNFQELKDWVRLGLDLSKESNLYITYLVTTNIADGGGSVEVRPNRYPSINTKMKTEVVTRSIPVEETVILSPRTAVREETLASRYEILLQRTRGLGLNTILRGGNKKKPFGFISSGLAFNYLEHALEILGVREQIPVLKLGITFPLDAELVVEFSKQIHELFVIEEKRDFIESQVATILTEAFQKQLIPTPPPLWGKAFPSTLLGIPDTRGLNPSILVERIGNLLLEKYSDQIYFESSHIKTELEFIRQTSVNELTIPTRTPTFCPGCPHRDSSSVLIEIKKKFRDPEYMKSRFNRKPLDLLFHGDTGCYTMLMFEPNQELMHNYSGMGLGGGTGAGIDPFITNKQIVFMGDSTFFHSGMIAISDAIKHGQDITFIILDNGTIAMTGHQPTPGTESDLMGNPTVAQSIDQILRGMSIGTKIPIHRINPGYRESYFNLLEDTILKDGVKVIVADKECRITYDRKVVRDEKQTIKVLGYLPQKTFMHLSTDVCENCLECTIATGCPGLTQIDSSYGTKIGIDLSWCRSDGACAKIQACPSFSEVTVTRTKAPESGLDRLPPIEIPEVTPLSFDKTWSAYLAGIGGMGIGVTTAILVRAGFNEGYTIRFLDKKGLAIRNGGVYSHIHFAKNESFISPVTPYGKADLLLGLDILEATRSIDPKQNIRIGNPEKTSALINTHKNPTIATLTGKENFEPAELERMIKKQTRSNQYLGLDLSALSEEFLGNKLFLNLIILGIAYQKKLLPIRLANLKLAVEATVPSDALEPNWQAFNLGRRLVYRPNQIGKPKDDNDTSLLHEKMKFLKKSSWLGHKKAFDYHELVQKTLDRLTLSNESKKELIMRIYDLIQYENIDFAKSYVALITQLNDKDSGEFDRMATKLAIRYLYKVMAIKDEVYVAYLLTRDEERLELKNLYQIDPKRGDRVQVRYKNKPEFILFGQRIRFRIDTQPWQLHLMRRMKWLRQLMPYWHLQEKQFRDWYIELVRDFKYNNKMEYDRYVSALSTPEIVKGYREIRYPKLEQAIRLAKDYWSGAIPPKNLADENIRFSFFTSDQTEIAKDTPHNLPS